MVLIRCSEAHYAPTGKSLFSSTHDDLSERALEENIAIAKNI